MNFITLGVEDFLILSFFTSSFLMNSMSEVSRKPACQSLSIFFLILSSKNVQGYITIIFTSKSLAMQYAEVSIALQFSPPCPTIMNILFTLKNFKLRQTSFNKHINVSGSIVIVGYG